MLGPVYGFGWLKLPPAGVPDKLIDVPEHPFTLEADTVGKGRIVIVCESILQPFAVKVIICEPAVLNTTPVGFCKLLLVGVAFGPKFH